MAKKVKAKSVKKSKPASKHSSKPASKHANKPASKPAVVSSKSTRTAVKSVARVERATKKASKVATALAKELQAGKGGKCVDVTITTKALHEAPQEHHFVLCDGRHIKSLYELVDELETMGDSLFHQHVNAQKNDFANWIRDVFDDKLLSEDLQRVHHRVDAQRAILKHLVRELRNMMYRKK